MPILSFEQQYSIDWYKIAGSGGMSSGRNFSLSVTIGHSKRFTQEALEGQQ